MCLSMSNSLQDFNPIEYINHPRWKASRLGLNRIRKLLERLGRPQDRLRFVHVAGTNGKGSVCAYISAILQQAGYKVGTFTSPYIEKFEERIRVCDKNISYSALKAVTLQVKECASAQELEMDEHPTEFELMTAVALMHFANERCEVVVLEVGLGGRLDSTNVIDAPDVCAIARIGLDHTSILGSTLAEIASEKAAIIKHGCSACVTYPQENEAQHVIQQAANEAGVKLTTCNFEQLEIGAVKGGFRNFMYKGQVFKTQLLATCQPKNAAVAIDVAYKLRECSYNISDVAIASGVETAMWPGRFEVLETKPNMPLVVLDGAHNVQATKELANSLVNVFGMRKFVFICGVMADKNYEAMLKQIANLSAALICVTPNNPRALSAGKLAQCARFACKKNVDVFTAKTFELAAEMAVRAAGLNGIICAFGSLYMLADIKRAFRKTYLHS